MTSNELRTLAENLYGDFLRKLERGTFAATFLIACIAALGLTGLDLEEI